MMMSTNQRTPSRLQQGSVLLVAVVVLLLASLMALMAMNVGVFEQRSSGNDLRAKIVNQVAEAGLAQGFEYLFRARPELINDNTLWESCAGIDTFPCGAVPAAMRASMFRLQSGKGGYTDTGLNPLDAALTNYMIPNSSVLPATGGFGVAYGVAPVLCRVSLPVSSTNVSCGTGTTNLSDRRVVTFVSVAQIRGDTGRTTLTQTVARSSLLAQGANVSALIATGNVNPSGTGEIVAMPDAGGDGSGLNISVWSRLNLDIGSAFATCERAAFLADSSTSLNNPDWRAASLAGGCPNTSVEGWDVLDIEPAGSHVGINNDVKPSEFPPDLFEYAFGVKTWVNGPTSTDANFYETRIASKLVTVNGKKAVLYPDEAFLYQNATQIIGDDLGLARADQIKANPSASSSGLIWCKFGCAKGPPGGAAAVGSVAKPVVFVVDGEMQVNSTIFYGMVFMRDPNPTVNETTGGIASFKQNGTNAAVFGSVFIQGEFATGSGNGPVVGDREVMLALSNSSLLSQYDTLRGGWTDKYSF